MTHELETHPEPFQATLDGLAPFEVQLDDRHYEIGDLLRLREWDPKTDMKYPNGYTGREVTVRLTYLARGRSWGLPAGLCILGVARLNA
jgi:hypothetical protein